MFSSSALVAMHRNKGKVRVVIGNRWDRMEKVFYVSEKPKSWPEFEMLLAPRQTRALKKFIRRCPSASLLA